MFSNKIKKTIYNVQLLPLLLVLGFYAFFSSQLADYSTQSQSSEIPLSSCLWVLSLTVQRYISLYERLVQLQFLQVYLSKCLINWSLFFEVKAQRNRKRWVIRSIETLASSSFLRLVSGGQSSQSSLSERIPLRRVSLISVTFFALTIYSHTRCSTSIIFD